MGAKADPEQDVIEVDGKRVSFAVDKVYLVLNKPLGYVTTVSDPHAKHKVMDLIQGLEQRVYPVGRLDADSAGLLLLTNDGDFTERLTHPKHQVPKTYRVIVRHEVPEWAAADLRKGIMLEDGMTAPALVEWVDFDEQNNASIIDITIHEGRNRQVRRMFDAIGYPVLALTRMRIGPIQLKGIAPGTWRKLHPSEVKALFDASDSAPLSLPQVPVTDVDPEPEARPEPRPQRKGAPSKPRGARQDKPHDTRQQGPQAPRQDRPQAAQQERRPDSRQDRPRDVRQERPAGQPKRAPKTPATERVDGLRAAAKELAARLRAAGKDDDEPAPPPRKSHDKGRKPK